MNFKIKSGDYLVEFTKIYTMTVFKKSLFLLLFFVSSYSCFAQEISIWGGLNLSQFNHQFGDTM